MAARRVVAWGVRLPEMRAGESGSAEGEADGMRTEDGNGSRIASIVNQACAKRRESPALRYGRRRRVLETQWRRCLGRIWGLASITLPMRSRRCCTDKT